MNERMTTNLLLPLGLSILAAAPRSASQAATEAGSQETEAREAAAETTMPPPARRVEASDELHGVRVHDPYRWLEEMESEEVLSWVRAQDDWTRARLGSVPRHDAFEARLREISRYARFGSYLREGERSFYSLTEPGEKTAAFYVQEGEADPSRLIDPNPLSEDGRVRLKLNAVAPGGEHVAYVIGGSSRWGTIRIREVASGEDAAEGLVGYVGGGVAWTQDGEGFFYLRYDVPEPGTELTAERENLRLLHHRLGTDQTDDRVVYRPARPTQLIGNLYVTPDGRYFAFAVAEGASPDSGLMVVDLQSDEWNVRELLPEGQAGHNLEHAAGSTFFVRTDLDAPRGKLVAIDLSEPERENWRDVLTESEHALTGLSVVGERFIATYLVDAVQTLRVFDFEGEGRGEVPLASVGGIVFGLNDRPDTHVGYYSFSSPFEPGAVYRHDFASGEREVFSRPELSWNPEDYVTEHLLVESEQGVRVPLFLSYKGEIERDGQNPVLMYGYGAYGWPAYPWFNPFRLLWMELGGIHATAGIRGGGEYGAEWHKDGIRANKQNGIDDFLACSRWLIEAGYTSPAKLAVQGGARAGWCRRPRSTKPPSSSAQRSSTGLRSI